ncbi:MAG: hypothetical protein ACI9JL_000154 [Paracoccaceae bacterium]|jgi:hypothetical protein
MHGNLHRNALGTAPTPDRVTPDFARPSDPAADSPTNPPSDSPDECAPGIQVLRLADRDATLRRATGSADARVHGWLVNDLSFALNMPPALDAPGLDTTGYGGQARADRVCAAVSAMCDIAPRDTLEGMLAVQMVAVHSAALDSLRRAAEPDAADRAREADLRHAARLLNVFQRQMRVRDDRRNPVLAHSLTGRHAPDAAGRPPGARVAPAARVALARGDTPEDAATGGPTDDQTGGRGGAT